MDNRKKRLNIVDERFELLALIFRLAGRQEYNDSDTEYQKKLNYTFEKIKPPSPEGEGF